LKSEFGDLEAEEQQAKAHQASSKNGKYPSLLEAMEDCGQKVPF
jgi:hypothetical protein